MIQEGFKKISIGLQIGFKNASSMHLVSISQSKMPKCYTYVDDHFKLELVLFNGISIISSNGLRAILELAKFMYPHTAEC